MPEKVSVNTSVGYQPSAAKVPKQKRGSFGVICYHQATGLMPALQEQQELEAMAASSGAPCLRGPASQAFSETLSAAVSQLRKVASAPAQLVMCTLGLGSSMSLRYSASVPPALPIL